MTRTSDNVLMRYVNAPSRCPWTRITPWCSLKWPNIDGFHVPEQIKHDLKTRHIPVHIITGSAEDKKAMSLREGATAAGRTQSAAIA